MSSIGWIRIHREIMDHWVWHDDRYFKWWMAILLNVNHTETKFPVNGELETCRSGESFKSINEWCHLCGCTKKAFYKFLGMLEVDQMVTRKTIGKGNRRKHLLTVVNWEKYQRNGTEKDTERAPERAPENDPLTRMIKNEENDKNLFLSEKNFSDLFSDWKNHFQTTSKVKLTPEIVKQQSEDLCNKSNGDITTATEIIKRAIGAGYRTFTTIKKNDHNETRKLADSNQHAKDAI